jgi:hypothetical protein
VVDLNTGSRGTFIDLHQARWGAEGLFPATEGGARSRRFMHRLAELEAAEGDGRRLQLGRFEVGGRVVFATVGFDDGVECLFYNAGVDPEARDLSPGVTGTAAYLRDRLAAGRRRFDFLRGDEAYKYEWGALDDRSSASSCKFVWAADDRALDDRSLRRSPGPLAPRRRRADPRRAGARDRHQWRCPGGDLVARPRHGPRPL